MAKAPKYLTVKPKGEVKAPLSYDPGKGRPKEHLSYLNKDEMKALKRMNGNNMERGPKGLPSFPPADAIGSSSKAPSSKSSAGPRSGTSGSVSPTSGSKTGSGKGPSMGGGNMGGQKSSGPSGGMMGGTGSGGSSRTSPSAGAGGGDRGLGTQKAGAGPKSPMSGQGTSYKTPDEARHATGRAINKSFMENTRAQNEARMATERAKGFGPRIGADLTGGTVSPSQIAAQNTLDRIASGSSVIGRQNVNKFQGQVPSDLSYRPTPSQVVNVQQGPTVGPNRGLGTSPARPAAYASSAAMFKEPAAPVPVGPDPHQAWADATANSPYNRRPLKERMLTPSLMDKYYPGNRAALDQAYAEAMASQPQAASLGKTRGLTAADVAGVAAMPSGTYFGGPQSYPGQGNISPVNTTETPAEQAVRKAPVQGMGQYDPNVQKLMDPIANWAADKLGTNVSPSQQDSRLVRLDQALANTFGTPGPDSAYARAMGNAANRASERPAYTPPTQSYAPNATLGTTTAAAPPPALAPLPPYVNYQQLPPDYSTYNSGVAPSQPIMDFMNGYGGGVAGYASGGTVGGGSSFEDRLSFGLKNAPSDNPFFKLAYAIGLPTFTRGRGDDGWHQVGRDMRMAQMMSGETPAAKPAPATPSAPAQSPAYPQLSQYVLPPPDKSISDYNNADVLGQQEQLFRLPQKRGGGVGDRIDAAIRLAKSFS